MPEEEYKEPAFTPQKETQEMEALQMNVLNLINKEVQRNNLEFIENNQHAPYKPDIVNAKMRPQQPVRAASKAPVQMYEATEWKRYY